MVFGFFSSSSPEKETSSESAQATTPTPSEGEGNGKLKFINGVKAIPHDDKAHKGGEDAWAATDRLIAVADGVGGWARHGVDPGLFSK